MDQTHTNADACGCGKDLDLTFAAAKANGFSVSKIDLHSPISGLSYKMDGIVLYLCIEGELTITIKDKSVELKKCFITASVPDHELSSITPNGDTTPSVLIIAITRKYLFDLKFDIREMAANMRFDRLDPQREIHPKLRLSDDECAVTEGYCGLIRKLSKAKIPHRNEYLAMLMTSLLYIFNRALVSRISELAPPKYTVEPASRSKSVFADFMALAVENFEMERSIQFYADKLCLTPKYLSKLMKDACGHSASDIIDNLVMSKARNLLKHSDLSVKEIAAQLNFSNQSSFNKFFKANSGMPPLKYRED